MFGKAVMDSTFDIVQEFDFDGVKKTQRLFGRNVSNAFKQTFKVMQDIIRARVPRNSKNADNEFRRPARLYETVQLNNATVQNASATLWTDNEIWYYYNEDMPAHIIQPRGSVSDLVAGTGHQALAFMWKGKLVFFKKVQHPGSKGHHYWDEADQYMKAVLPQMTKLAGDAALRGEAFTGGDTSPLTDAAAFTSGGGF
jgi:hypothetical protein